MSSCICEHFSVSHALRINIKESKTIGYSAFTIVSSLFCAPLLHFVRQNWQNTHRHSKMSFSSLQLSGHVDIIIIRPRDPKKESKTHMP